VKNSYLDIPVVEERSDVRLLLVPRGAVAEGINIWRQIASSFIEGEIISSKGDEKDEG